MSGGGFKPSIPSSVNKTIQNIKEITGNHSDDEIYAMLKECSMDPNETAQRLLLQDTFHEVKRKRDKRKENLNNKELAESRWKAGTQGRGSRSVRGTTHPTSLDASVARSSGPGSNGGNTQAAEKALASSVASQDMKNKESSSAASMANGPASAASITSKLPARDGGYQSEISSSLAGTCKPGSDLSSADSKNPAVTYGRGETSGLAASSSNSPVLITPASSAAVCFSASDPVLVPSYDSRVPGAIGTIKREVGNRRSSSDTNSVVSVENKSTAAASEVSSSSMQGKMPAKFQGIVKNQFGESAQPSSTSLPGSSSGSRPSSNYGGHSQQIIGPQKVGSNKEWKPKSMNSGSGQMSGTVGATEVSANSVEASALAQPASKVDSEDPTSDLQKKLEELHLPQRQHVIIPNHIHVPESERTKLSFGSFDAAFGVSSPYVSGPESDKSSTPLSETSQGIDESMDEQVARNQSTLTTAEEGDFPDQPRSPIHAPENSSGEGNVSTNSVAEYNENKHESVMLSGAHQYPMVHTSNYSFGFVPPMLGSQIAPFENSDSQAHDVSRLPSFVVQQSFDPTSYYAQFYRPGTDNDGRVSPFPSAGVAPKYNGNIAVLPSQTSQSPQEGGSSLVLTTTGPTPLVTQAAGLMQSSIAVTQQPVPVFRPPAGVHISHYPPNYIPYGHYFSPFYVPPPAIHQFLSNGAFPQQPQAGGLYPSPPTAPTTGVKFSLPQYKTGTNTGNSAHMGVPSGYGPYGTSPAGYNPSSAGTVGNSTTNEDLTASQFKENNVYITGQQSEGSGVWIAAPGRDISSLPAGSFYNLPPQGQHVTFAPTQAAPGSFSGIYHPAQAVTAASVHPLLQPSQTMAGAVDMVGSAASVYQQQPQHAQMNWPSNY